MRQSLRETLAVARSARLGTSPSDAVSFIRRGAAETVAAFDQVVAPLVETTISDPVVRAHAMAAFLSASVKGGFLIYSYARMTRHPYPAELVALGGSFTRLYDDLIDETETVRLVERISLLFHGGPFDPSTELERLFEEIFHAIQQRLDRPADDSLYTALRSLHEWQVLSREQRNPEINSDMLRQITIQKGGLANVALFGLVRQAMTREETQLVIELGAIFQLMDDYIDAKMDRAGGIHTLVTRGEVTATDITARLCTLVPRVRRFYGTGSRPFLTVVYMLLVAAHYKHISRNTFVRGTKRRGSSGPLGTLLFRGRGTLPGSS